MEKIAPALQLRALQLMCRAESAKRQTELREKIQKAITEIRAKNVSPEESSALIAKALQKLETRLNTDELRSGAAAPAAAETPDAKSDGDGEGRRKAHRSEEDENSGTANPRAHQQQQSGSNDGDSEARN